MTVQILSPVKVLFEGEVDSIAVPSTNGEFQMLNNHAPVVSILKQGRVKIFTKESLDDFKNFIHDEKENHHYLEIGGGVLEMNQNKAIILVD